MTANVKVVNKEKEIPGKETKENKELKNNKFQKPPLLKPIRKRTFPQKRKKLRFKLYFLVKI